MLDILTALRFHNKPWNEQPKFARLHIGYFSRADISKYDAIFTPSEAFPEIHFLITYEVSSLLLPLFLHYRQQKPRQYFRITLSVHLSRYLPKVK